MSRNKHNNKVEAAQREAELNLTPPVSAGPEETPETPAAPEVKPEKKGSKNSYGSILAAINAKRKARINKQRDGK